MEKKCVKFTQKKIECTKRGADGKGVWDAESKDT